MRAWLVALLGLFAGGLGATTPAHAQPSPDIDWSGFYLGASAGGTHGIAGTQATTTDGFPGSYFTTPDPAQIKSVTSGDIVSDSFSAGLFAGYGRQWDQLYFGLEGGVGVVNLTGSRKSGAVYLSNPDGTFTNSVQFTADWQASLKARLGLTHDRWLAYVTAGPALARLDMQATFADNFLGVGAFGQSAFKQTKLGLSLGLGAEYALDDNWSVRADYLFTDFGTVSTSASVVNPAFPTFANTLTNSLTLRTHAVSLGLSYRF